MMRKTREKVTCSTESTKGFKLTTPTIPINIADLEERMKMLTISTTEDEEMGDTFAERAESYYQKRPQLMTLLQDLYNGYITLSDRYIQTLAKQKHHVHGVNSSKLSALYDADSDLEEATGVSQIDSDIESSISYQQPHMMLPSSNTMFDVDAIVAELVIKNVEYDILMHEFSSTERKYSESTRKIDLQKSLLEVLESERLVLLNENASLGYRISSLMDENKGLASESAFIKRKAGELAKCVLKMREDHRVYMLNKKIEDLQAQINGLEKRNKEYYELLVRGESPEDCSMEKKGKNGDRIALEIRFQMARLSRRFKWKDAQTEKKSPGLWKKVKTMDLFMCGINPTCA